MSAVQPFVTTRVYDAPRGFQTRQNRLDLRPGGLYHYCLRMPDGTLDALVDYLGKGN